LKRIQREMNKHCLLIGIAVSLMLTHACAQGQYIDTDRPGQANASVLVPRGALQIEMGMGVEKDDTQKQACINYVYNNSILRFGVNENFEARLALGYLGVKQFSDQIPVRKGFAPIAIGVKIKLADQHSVWPQAALITNVTLKTGTAEFKPPFTCTDVTLALSRSFGSKLSLTINSGVKWNGDSPEGVWLYALSVGYNLTDKLASFVESYGFFPEAHQADHRADFGITYKILPRLQFDASGGIGISENSKKIFVSTGASFRLFK
jgi:hypothetical protein